MRRCIQNFVDIHYTNCKIVRFKVDKQVFFQALSRAKISSLSNFQKIYIYFFDCRTSFYANKLGLEFMKRTTSEEIVVFTFQKNIK